MSRELDKTGDGSLYKSFSWLGGGVTQKACQAWKAVSLRKAGRIETGGCIREIVKRPLLVGDVIVLTGFREAEWAEKLL